MSESRPRETIEEGPSVISQEPPPLGIGHLLMFTSGIAIALGFIAPMAKTLQPNQSAQDFAMIFVISVPVGLAGAFLAWLVHRDCHNKPVLLIAPAAKFAALLSALMLMFTLLLIADWVFITFDSRSSSTWVFSSHLVFHLIALPIWGIVCCTWIKDKTWRVIAISQALGTMIFCLFPIPSAVGGAAMVYAFTQDRQAKQSWHWIHYFSIVLWTFSQFVMACFHRSLPLLLQ